MKPVLRPLTSFLALVLALAVPSLMPAQSTKDRLLEIQRDVALLQGALMESDRGTGQKIAALEALMKQNLEAITKLNQALAVIESAVNRQGDQVVGPVVNTAAKVKPTATAASTALPPDLRTSTPTRVALGSAVTTIALRACTGSRLAAGERRATTSSSEPSRARMI